MMRNIFTSLVAAVPMMLMMSTGARADDLVAVVGTKNITLKEFNEKYSEVVKQTINPPKREVFLEDLVRYEMGVQEAMKKGLQDDPIVKERIRQEIYKGLIERELGERISKIKVTEKEMQAFYQKNPEVRTSHILIEFRPDANDEQKKAARDRASEIFDEVKKSRRPFEELVALYTDDPLSKRSGGDVGWQSSITLVPSYYDAALATKVGQLYPKLVETQYGFHIIKATGRHSYPDANKRQIRMAVFDEKRKEVFDAYFARLKKGYPVKVNKALLAK